MHIILGPTASGKSDYAIALASTLDGEVISADSRQVYRGMDIGTGKVPRDTPDPHGPSGAFYSNGIRHHLLDIASPKRNYNVTHFVRDATKAITDITRREKVPILCGGTAFWIETLLLGTRFPQVKPNLALRATLGTHSANELFAMLQHQDPDRAATIDAHNKIRLIRALEIIDALGTVPKTPPRQLPREHSIIVLNPPKDLLHARIEKRLKERLEHGMVEEVARLHHEGVSWKRLEQFGLEYRYCARLLQQKISRDALVTELLSEIKHYAKRQLTFLRRLERLGLHMTWHS